MDTLIDAFGHIWQYGSWIIAVILVVFGLLALKALVQLVFKYPTFTLLFLCLLIVNVVATTVVTIYVWEEYRNAEVQVQEPQTNIEAQKPQNSPLKLNLTWECGDEVTLTIPDVGEREGIVFDFSPDVGKWHTRYKDEKGKLHWVLLPSSAIKN
jgi:hypothetical protein